MTIDRRRPPVFRKGNVLFRRRFFSLFRANSLGNPPSCREPSWRYKLPLWPAAGADREADRGEEKERAETTTASAAATAVAVASVIIAAALIFNSDRWLLLPLLLRSLYRSFVG